jgi:hypothetical protein
MRNNYAALFIPFRKEDQGALTWRLSLINEHKVHSAGSLIQHLKLAQTGSLEEATRTELIRFATSSAIIPDEFELTTLIVAGWLIEAGTMPKKKLLFIDRKARSLLTYDLSKKEDEDDIKNLRSNLTRYGQRLLKNEVLKIRAKLAFQELVALVAPDEMIPALVELTPSYLSCSFVQNWIRKNRLHQLNGIREIREAASTNMTHLAKTLPGNRRQKKRKYPYWRIGILYEDLADSIAGFRKQLSKGTLNLQYFDLYCDSYEVPNIYRKPMLSFEYAPRQLALDIIVGRGLLPDTKAFLDFQPHITEIQNKHFGGKVLSIAMELSPIIFDFLDLPKCFPEVVENLNPWAILERVPTGIGRPTF